MYRAILVGFIYLPIALAQAVPPAPSQPISNILTDKWYLVDKVMGVVTPSEPTELTETKRFHLYVLSVAGPVPLLGEAVGATFGQWRNTPKEWGQGWGAFGQRFGSNLAYNGVRQTITYGTSVLFHEDNRYFASHKQGVGARTSYALLSTVTARKPNGTRAVSISSIVGVFGASAITSLWGPPSWKGAGAIARAAGISFGTTAAFNVVREFLPGILHRLQTQPTKP